MAAALYLLIQCTWGALQTLLGLGVFLIHYSCPHQRFYGAVHTCWTKNSGVSLGMFIFTPGNGRDVSVREEMPVRGNASVKLKVHEYGHTIQSLLLGPFYLLVIGIPSMVWFRAPRLQKLRVQKQIPYSAFYTERWADWLGTKVTGLESDGG